MAGRIRIAVAGASFAVATGVAAYFGYLRMFTGFLSTDDEGFMLVALRSFNSGQTLYDKVVLQYGPFYFEVFGLLGGLGVPFDNDSGRLVTLVVWLAIALVAGVAVFAFTRSLPLGLSTYLITFATAALTSEPMHPAGLVCLLLIAIAAVAFLSAGRWSGPWPFFLIGALAAAAILTKINVGAFAAISIAFACVVTFPALNRNWPTRLIAAAVFVAVPFLLTRADLDQRWAQRFAIHIGVCAAALVVAISASRPDSNRRLPEIGWLVVGGTVTALLVCVIALFRGSSPDDLLHGIILNPLTQSQVFSAPIDLPSTRVWDVIAVGGAVLWTLYRMFARRPRPALEGALRLLAGLAIWITLIGSHRIPVFTDSLVQPLALAWVVAAPRGRPDGFEDLDFARTLIAAIAILQSLHAYPIPGSQVAWAALTLIPLGAVCIADGLSQLGLKTFRLHLATSLMLLILAVSWIPAVWQQSRSAYAADVALGLPGAQLVRVPADQAVLLRQVTQSIRDNCDAFISIPGLDSFYIWGRLNPPPPLPTRWMWLAGDFKHQEALVETSKRIERLCVLENDELITAWSRKRVTDGPLLAYIQANFEPAYTFDHYLVLKRRLQ